MKMVFITYNEAIDGAVMDVLKQNGLDAYTKWQGVMGVGHKSEPHLMSHVWPKGNNAIMTACSETQASGVLDGIRALRKTLGHEGAKAFIMPIEDLTA